MIVDRTITLNLSSGKYGHLLLAPRRKQRLSLHLRGTQLICSGRLQEPDSYNLPVVALMILFHHSMPLAVRNEVTIHRKGDGVGHHQRYAQA